MDALDAPKVFTARIGGDDPAPLATEALRGAGAVLVNADEKPFMQRYHRDRDLAPRDVVARAVEAERAAGRGAFLDARTAIGEDFAKKFPTVFAACQRAFASCFPAIAALAPSRPT